MFQYPGNCYLTLLLKDPHTRDLAGHAFLWRPSVAQKLSRSLEGCSRRLQSSQRRGSCGSYLMSTALPRPGKGLAILMGVRHWPPCRQCVLRSSHPHPPPHIPFCLSFSMRSTFKILRVKTSSFHSFCCAWLVCWSHFSWFSILALVNFVLVRVRACADVALEFPVSCWGLGLGPPTS